MYDRKIYDKKYRQTDKYIIAHRHRTKIMRNLYKSIFANLRINGCAICGSYKILEFHHVNPIDKRFVINRGWGYSNENIIIELDKCILLCRKCHKKVHKNISI